MSLRSTVALSCLSALAAACGCPEEVVPEPPPFEPWPGEDERPALDHSFFEAHPALGDLSLWAAHVSGPPEERPGPADRGAFLLGNGRVFALAGLADPLDTLHAIAGPVYDAGERFFADQSVLLEVDGAVADAFDEEWAARPRGTAMLVTRADAGELTLWTVDLAPRLADGAPPAILRVLLVANRGEEARRVRVRLRAARDLEERGGLLVDAVDADGRLLAPLPWGDGTLDAADGDLALDLGELGPGAEAEAAVVLVAARDADEALATRDALAARHVGEVVEETLDAWLADAGAGLRLELPDPRVEDLLDGVRAAVLAQRSAGGAISPMSRYTRAWMRDTAGAVRFLLRSGLREEARDALEYLHLCHAVEGDIQNSCSAAYTADDLAAEPDWASMPPMEGRTAAEGPSWLAIAARDLVPFTGERELVVERWDWLSRAVLVQSLDAEGRQPFSGDETFRTAMEVALGYDLGTAWEEVAWSANSSVLLAVAAGWMAEVAPAVGRDPAPFAEREAAARGALEAHFVANAEHIAPFVLVEDGRVEERPFEDVNLRPTWLGLLDAETDALAWSDLEALRASAGRGDGTVQTPADDRYRGLGFDDGLGTGLVPGLYLWDLAAAGDPEAEAAFDAAGEFADPAGQYAEYVRHAERAPWQAVYDPSGENGDLSARARPWEGGVVADAIIGYLLGPLAGPAADLVLAPHLPDGWPALRAEGVSTAAAAATVEVERTDGGVAVRVASTAPEGFSLRLDVPEVPELAGLDVRASCEPPLDVEVVELPGGERRARAEVAALAPEESVRCALTVP